MRTNFLNRTKPIHYVIISTLFLCLFLWHFIREFDYFSALYSGWWLYVQRLIVFLGIIAALFVGIFIVNRNKLDKQSSYVFLINTLFYIIFWDIFSDINIVIANLLVILALRYLISSKSYFISKSRIFNASFFIAFASIFHPWALLILVLVFVSIFTTFQNDYKRVIVPFIGVGVVTFWYAMVIVFQYDNFEQTISQMYQLDFSWFYFSSPIKQVLFISYHLFIGLALLSFFYQINVVSKKVKSSYFKLFLLLLLSSTIALTSSQKSNNLFVFTFFPVSLFLARIIETTNKYWIKRLLLITLTVITILSFSSIYWEHYLF